MKIVWKKKIINFDLLSVLCVHFFFFENWVDSIKIVFQSDDDQILDNALASLH